MAEQWKGRKDRSRERDAIPGVNYIHTNMEQGVGLEQSGILQEETVLMRERYKYSHFCKSHTPFMTDWRMEKLAE